MKYYLWAIGCFAAFVFVVALVRGSDERVERKGPKNRTTDQR